MRRKKGQHITEREAVELVAEYLIEVCDLSQKTAYDEANRWVNTQNYRFGQCIEYSSKYTKGQPVMLGRLR